MSRLCYINQNRRILLVCLYLSSLITWNRNAVALERGQDPCVKFVLSGSEKEYSQCLDLIEKTRKTSEQNIAPSFDLSWLREPSLQIKFTNDVASGKLLPMKLAFDIEPLLDGELGEVVSISLGQAITKSTEEFLIQLQTHYQYGIRLDSLVGNLGPEYVDELEKQIMILKKRRTAITNVNNASLKNVKTMVIKELDRQIALKERATGR